MCWWLRGAFNACFRYLRCDNMCSAETMISALQIPLQLKLLHPWNRGIHGYIRSFCVCLCSFAVPTFSLIHHLEDISVPPQGFWQLWFGFYRRDLRWTLSITLMRIDRLLNVCINYECNPYLQLPAWLRESEMQSMCRGCRLKRCIGASPIRHVCSLQNNLLPWQRSFIIQAHCYLLSQQELNVP